MNKLFGREKFWLLLLGLLFLPFLILSFYTHPSADDFIVAAVVRDNGMVTNIKQVYFEWSGRYFSTFIKCFTPLVYGWMWGYKLIPFILISLFYGSVYFLIHTIFAHQFTPLRKHLITLILVLLYFDNIPSTPECMYWMDGSLNYFLANTLLLFFFGLLLKSWYATKIKTGTLIAFFLLPLVIIGSNEVSMLALDEFLLLIIVVSLILKKKINKSLAIASVAALVSTIIEVTAPGNYVKMNEYFTGHSDIAFSIQCCVLSFLKISAQFIRNPLFIIVSMIYIAFLPLFYSNKMFKGIINFSPFYTIPISVLILISLYFPVAYSTGLNPALRIHNCVSLFFIFLWFLNIAALHNFLLSKNKIVVLEIPRYLIVLLAAGAFILTVTRFSKEPGKEIVCEGNIFRAFYDLYYNAGTYNTEMNERLNIIEKAKQENKKYVEVPALTHIPASIHFMDITDKANHWINVSAARYYRLDSIKIKTK